MSRRGRSARIDRVRLAAVDLLRRWMAGDRPIATLVGDFERRARARDVEWSYGERRRLRELLFGSVRLKQRYATMVEQRVARPGGVRRCVRAALMVALHEICELSAPAFATVDQAVAIVRLRQNPPAARFVNAILRRVLNEGIRAGFPSEEEDPVGHATTWLSHPRWMVERWAERYGTDSMLALCRANNQRKLLVVRTPVGRRQEALDLFARLGWESGASPYAPQAVELRTRVPAPLVLDQCPLALAVQDAAAQLVAPLCMTVGRAGRLLDLCAAPGGKASHLVELAGKSAQVVASDASTRRIPSLRETLRRTGATRAAVVVADGRHPPFVRNAFDAVLVDAPCTGTGVLARRHEARWRRTPDDLRALAILQERLLNVAVDLVRPGGYVVYATCSLEPEENDAVVDAVLAGRDDATEVGVGENVPEPLRPGGRLRTLPHLHGMDGAFAARLRKEVRSS